MKREKKALLRLHSKLNKPAQFRLKEGMILTENANQEDRETINGSRALLPGAIKLFKVLSVHEGGMGCLCKNLSTGKYHF